MPQDVAKTIYKVLKTSKPKCSYCIGADSYFACLISKILPQALLNKLIAFHLKRKLK